MQKIQFIKMLGLGNDFVIIDRRIDNVEINKDIINKLSDRRTGAGCDQVLTIDKNTSFDHDARIQIFNPNGDSAEACGNGTRCVAKLLFEEKNTTSIKLQSQAGILNAKKIDDDTISVNLGKVSHKWKDIPLAKEANTLNLTLEAFDVQTLGNDEHGFYLLPHVVAVNVGNPHVVFFGKNINQCDLENFGPTIENHALFPEKTNVEIVEIINRKTIKMRVWERGAGVTLSCGSGACAAVYASILKDMTDNDVEVRLEKGSLQVKIRDNEAIMIGPAEESFRGYIEI